MLTVAEKAERALRIVREAKELAYDTETSGLDWKTNWPIGYVITDDHESHYIPVRHGGGGNLNDPKAAPLKEADERDVETHQFEVELAKAFDERRATSKITIGHNLKFDMHFSAKKGIILGRNCRDTEIQAAMLDEYQRSFSLETTAQAYQVEAKKGEELYRMLHERYGAPEGRKSMGEFWRSSGIDHEVVEYAEQDGTTTLLLHRKQMPHIVNEDMELIHLVESELIYTIFRMEQRGIKVDMNQADALIAEMKEQILQAQLKLPAGFNPRSSVDVREFMESHNHTDWPMTKPSKKFPNGQPSFNEKWLKTKPEGKIILDLRQKTNLMNSFILPLIEGHVHNGRVYSSFNQLKNDEYGTISGRFSSSNPNMQQVPKRNKELGYVFRELFIPDEGMVFVEGDWSQCEPRLFAHYSGDPNLTAGYKSTPFRDAHQVVADLLGVERDPTAKRMNMGIFTGMQKHSFADHMGWDFEKASEAFDKWFQMFSSIKEFQNTAKNVFKHRGYVRSILGRRMRLDSPRFAYKGTSRIIQAGNADIVKYKMLEVDKFLESIEDVAQLLLTVHDSFGWQRPDSKYGEEINVEIVRICEDVQTPPISLDVPFVMDVGEGRNWAVATWGEK